MTERHKQVEEMMTEQLQATARWIQDNTCPDGWGFAVCMVPFDETGVALYVSNCDRADAIKLLRDTADAIKEETTNADT